jgi:hypothetical protein
VYVGKGYCQQPHSQPAGLPFGSLPKWRSIEVAADAIVSECAGIRDTDKEHQLLCRQAQQVDATYITGVKTPHAMLCKKSIPHYEKGGRSEARQPEKTPLAEEAEARMKGEQQRKNDTTKINDEVQQAVRH